MILRAALLLLMTTAAAVAGPRSEGVGTFLAITEDFSDTGGPNETSIYVESGGEEAFTLGIDTTRGETSEEWSAFAFIRQPLSAPGARDRLSVAAGVGAQRTEEGTEPLVVLGGGWNRDVTSGLGGWLSLAGEARYGANSGETELTGEATVAIEPVDRLALVNEFSVVGVPGSDLDPETQLTTSLVGTISERARLQLGATVDLSGNAPTGFRVGTWLEF